MLVTRVNSWSLTYCRCLGIEFQSQKFEVKSKELMVERFLTLDTLNLNWLESSMDPRYMDNLEKNTFKPCTPGMKKKKRNEKKGCVLSLLKLVSLLSVEKS